MRELQGAIIIGSAFQAFLGYSGAMALLVRYCTVLIRCIRRESPFEWQWK